MMLPTDWDASIPEIKGWFSGVLAGRGFSLVADVRSRGPNLEIMICGVRNRVLWTFTIDRAEVRPPQIAAAMLRVCYGHIVPSRPNLPEGVLQAITDGLTSGDRVRVDAALAAMLFATQTGPTFPLPRGRKSEIDVPALWCEFADEMAAATTATEAEVPPAPDAGPEPTATTATATPDAAPEPESADAVDGLTSCAESGTQETGATPGEEADASATEHQSTD